MIVLLALVVPVVANLPHKWVDGTDTYPFIRAGVTILSLLLAALTGIANFRKFGDLWLSYRLTEELLKHEKFLFLTKTGRYRNEATAFDSFTQSVESIISVEHGKFRAIIEEARRPSQEAGKN
jgi:hypothetical protein